MGPPPRPAQPGGCGGGAKRKGAPGPPTGGGTASRHGKRRCTSGRRRTSASASKGSAYLLALALQPGTASCRATATMWSSAPIPSTVRWSARACGGGCTGARCTARWCRLAAQVPKRGCLVRDRYFLSQLKTYLFRCSDGRWGEGDRWFGGGAGPPLARGGHGRCCGVCVVGYVVPERLRGAGFAPSARPGTPPLWGAINYLGVCIKLYRVFIK